VRLVPYDPAWPARFAGIRAQLQRACPWLRTVEHIGSTSVPGLGAKPTIDVMPGLARFEDGLRCVAPLQVLGFEYLGEYGLARRHYFRELRRVHVHMYAVGEGQWHAQLAFRDMLRSHAELRQAYWELKQELAQRHRQDVNAYADAKSDFVAQALRRAHAEGLLTG